MKLTKGMFSDCSPVDQPPGTYSFAKNVVNTNVLGALENEKGFTNLGIVAPIGYTIIGIVPTSDTFAVFSVNGGLGEIGYWDGSYHTVYNSADLNFSTNNPVKGEYRKDLNGDRIVAFIDDINKPRLINLDNPSISNIEDINIFQSLQNPTLGSYSIGDTGGSLLTGAYILLTRYASSDGSTETDWFVHDKVFYINDDSKSASFNLNDGCIAGTQSNKSITVDFENCDTAFELLQIGYLYIQAGVVTPYEVSTKALSSTTPVIITGNESSIKISLEEVLTSRSAYINAKAITQINGQLLLGNLETEALPNLQDIACNIRIDWYDANGGSLNIMQNVGRHKDVLPPVFMPGEVYAFYLGIELNNGQRAFYHIPGRAPVSNDTTVITTDGMSHATFQIEDTVNETGLGATTNMGYWENSNETYPNDSSYGSLQGLAVRHHRFPTTQWLANNTYVADTEYGILNLARLGITVSNVIIPALVQAQIKRWKIYFAKKTANNCLVVGEDLFMPPNSTFADANIRVSTGGTWTMDPENGSTWDAQPTDWVLDSHRGHSLDLMKDTSIIPDYVSKDYLLQIATGSAGVANSGVNAMYNGFGSTGLCAITGTDRGDNVGVVVDFTVDYLVNRSAKSGYNRIVNYTYLGQGARIGIGGINYSNVQTEACLISEFTSAMAAMAKPQLKTNSATTAPDASPFFASSWVETVHFTYYRLLSSVHSEFTNQELVPLEGWEEPATTSGNFVGGSAYLCYMSYLAANPRQFIENNDGRTGVRAWYGYVGYSRNNWNYRHQIQGTLGSYFYGKTEPGSLFNPSPSHGSIVTGTGLQVTCLLDLAIDSLNQIEYNDDYSYENTNQSGIIWSSTLVDQTKEPTLIIYSPVQNEESLLQSWRTFPSANRYVMPRQKGDIMNLQGLDNRNVLIHHTYSLFRTRTDIGLTASEDNVFLRSNALFSIQPEEIIASGVGYGGTQNKFSCILTKVGYAFVDDLQGKVFLYDGQALQEISSNGNRIIFRDTMGIIADNPFIGNGYTIVYDEFYNRLIIGKKQGATSWTASYNPITQSWVSFHDYTPDFMFALVANQVYSLHNGYLYKHNSGLPGLFYDGVTYPMFVDTIQNPDPTQDKVFVAANWLTESYGATGALDYTDTFTQITARSADHTTGRLDLSPFTEADALYQENLRNLNRVWYFNNLRDIALQTGFVTGFYNNYDLDPSKLDTNMEWFDQRKITDKYLILRLEYDNISGNRFLLLDNNIQYRNAVK